MPLSIVRVLAIGKCVLARMHAKACIMYAMVYAS
jgi:hypothetical protein